MFGDKKAQLQLLEQLYRLYEGQSKQINEIHAAMEPGRRLLAAEERKRSAEIGILWVSVNPKSGFLEHKLTTEDEIRRFLGTQYEEALVGLRDAVLGEVVYIDGAIFVKIRIEAGPMVNRVYDLRTKT